MENNNKLNIGFTLVKVNTEQFAIIPDSYKRGESVNLGTNLGFGILKDEQLLAVNATARFEQNNSPFLIGVASCHFKIDTESWNSFKVPGTENDFEIPQVFITHLSALAFGTLRGILHAKTEGTEFNGFVLPTLNVVKMITQNIRL